MARKTKKQDRPRILVVDDEPDVLHTLQEILQFEGYEVDAADSARAALKRLEKTAYAVVLTDVKMPAMDGLEMLARIREGHPELPVVMISGHGTIDMAVEAVKKGAFDFITKPPDLQRLLISIQHALERSSLAQETVRLRRKVRGLREIIGQSEAVQRVKALIDKVAPTEARVLIMGESGTGKELVARWIHEKSRRRGGPFVDVNCAAIPSELIESGLFGHEKGAFTHAVKMRVGKFEEASEGTLFLDEVGDMSLSAQAKVLRVLQEKQVARVGGNESIPVNPRVVAATNKNVESEIAAGRFRDDLFHRLAVVVITVPPLRQRREDIPLLIEAFRDEISEDYALPVKTFTPEAMAWLQSLPWRGNVRELRNAVERFVILGSEEITREEAEQLLGRGEDFRIELNIRDLTLKQIADHAARTAVRRYYAYYQDPAEVARLLAVSEADVKRWLADAAEEGPEPAGS